MKARRAGVEWERGVSDSLNDSITSTGCWPVHWILFQNSCTGYWRKNSWFGLDYLALIRWPALVCSLHSISLFAAVIQLDIYSFFPPWNKPVADVFLKAQGSEQRRSDLYLNVSCSTHRTHYSWCDAGKQCSFVPATSFFSSHDCRIHLYLSASSSPSTHHSFFLSFQPPSSAVPSYTARLII